MAAQPSVNWLATWIMLLASPAVIATDGGADKAAPKKPAGPYRIAHTAALDSKDSVVNQADDHTQYRVEFNGIKNDRVPAYLYVPKKKLGVPNPHPAILLQYGIGGNKKTEYIVAIGKQFVSRGYVVLTIDSPGVGERKSKDKKAPNAIIGMLLGGDHALHYCGDYSRAVDFLLTRPEVDKDRIGYVGISWGAITGITYVAYDERIKAAASMVGGGNFLNEYTPKAAEKAAREGSKSSDPVYHVCHIAPRPLLFINVTKDQLIMPAWAKSLHKAAGDGAKVVWLETDHYFRNLDRSAVCDSVIDFMNKSMPAKKRPEE
jgi:dienelactone hydrolase